MPSKQNHFTTDLRPLGQGLFLRQFLLGASPVTEIKYQSYKSGNYEIQNPLNFVNNFSELSQDLVQEIISSNNEEEKKEAVEELISNLEKINHHGNRAANIINQLQEHARSGTAQQLSLIHI